MNSSRDQHEKLWIVKSSTQLLGPYSEAEIYKQIKERQIVAIDEITKAFGNWSYVRDLDIFRDELLKAHAASAKDGDITKTMSSTTDSTDQLTATALEATEEITSAGGGVEKTNPNPDVAPLNTSALPRRPAEGFIKKPPQKQGFSWGRFFLSTLTFVVLLAGGIGGYWFYTQYKGAEINVADSLRLAQQGFVKGELRDSYKHFQNVIKVGDAEKPKGFYVQMAALVLNQERQTVYARDLLGQSFEDVQKTPEWLTVQGLSYLIDQNFKAAESYFLRSIKQNPNFLAAWVNIGHLYLSQKKYQEAWDYFYGAYIRGYYEGHIPLYMALTLIEQWQINSDRDLLIRAKDLINNYLSTSSDHKDLLSILKIWLNSKAFNSQSQLMSLVAKFIEHDPYSYSKIRQSPYEYVYETKNLESYCAEVFDKLPTNAKNTLLYKSLCYQRIGFVGDIVEGPINLASDRYTADPLVYGAKAVVLSQMGEQGQKSLLVGRALSSDENHKYSLPLILQAHFCEEKGDMACAYKYWKQVNERDPFVIGAYSGIAKYLMAQRKTGEAQLWVQSGLLLAPSYKPLIELQLKMM